MSANLLKTLARKALLLISLYLPKEKLIALPTANKKEGKTRSVGVNPCHAACSKGLKGTAPLPGVLTIIIKQIVMPRNTSNERNRSLAVLIPSVDLILIVYLRTNNGFAIRCKNHKCLFVLRCSCKSLYTIFKLYLIGFFNAGSFQSLKVSSLKLVISKDLMFLNLSRISLLAINCRLSLSKELFSQLMIMSVKTKRNRYFIKEKS